MKWLPLQSTAQIREIQQESVLNPVLIFKHSTHCSISRTVLNRLERNWKDAGATVLKLYYLDLIAYRDVSDQIADIFEVMHQSPQVLVIKNRKAIFDRSHFEIDHTTVADALKRGLKN
jgi:bacillithiol system protein YtxJ